MSAMFIYQILTPFTKREVLDPGFLVLDNSANERPDWYEYWPIRKFLLNESLDEESYYGFLSPKFRLKTNLDARAAAEFVSRQEGAADVVLLSPSLHLTAYHLNVFAYGETVHPGLLQLAERFFQHIGQPTKLQEFVTDSRNEVYSNYLIAKPRFWRAWLAVTEQLFALAESPHDALGAELRRPTRYRGATGVQMKIFIMERLATWILARDSSFTPRARDPFAARSRIYKLPGAIICDALKMAYATNRREQYKELFFLVSRFGRPLSSLIRIASFVGSKTVRRCVTALSSHWIDAGRS